MKLRTNTGTPGRSVWLALILMTVSLAASAQYALSSFTIAAGGGTSTNGQFAVTGTIGQPDAGNALTNGQYSAASGFWNLVNVVQIPGLPNLSILRVAPNSIVLSWPDPATNAYTLQQNASLDTTNWVPSGFAINSANGTNSVTINSPVGRLFFRLKQ